MIAADGLPGGYPGNASIFSPVSDSRSAIDWALSTNSTKYGCIEKRKIATAGHSCGGLEALSTAYHDARVSRILLFDISIFEDAKRYLLQAINVPIAWFEGGPLDFTSPLVRYILSVRDKLMSFAGCKRLCALEQRSPCFQGQLGYRSLWHLLCYQRREVWRRSRCVFGLAVSS